MKLMFPLVDENVDAEPTATPRALVGPDGLPRPSKVIAPEAVVTEIGAFTARPHAVLCEIRLPSP